MSSLLLSVAACAAAGAHAAPPPRVEIAYEVLREGSAIAEVVNHYEQGAGRYRIVETWKGRGLYSFAGDIVRASHGTLTSDGPRPAEFTDERSRRSPARAQFDWSAGILSTQRKSEKQTQALPGDAQDRLSFLLALAFAPPGKKPAVFSVTDGGGLSRYVYEAVGRERVKLPAGEFDALKVARRLDESEKRATEIWLAPSLGYLPVRILLIDKDGSRLDQQASRITFR